MPVPMEAVTDQVAGHKNANDKENTFILFCRKINLFKIYFHRKNGVSGNNS
jgi:hypothetical protein